MSEFDRLLEEDEDNVKVINEKAKIDYVIRLDKEYNTNLSMDHIHMIIKYHSEMQKYIGDYSLNEAFHKMKLFILIGVSRKEGFEYKPTF